MHRTCEYRGTKVLKINPNLQFVVKSGGLGNRMRGYELGALLGSSSFKRTGVMSCGE